MANRFIITSFILLLLTAGVNAQETTISPYSIFGIGDLQLGESGRTAGMAGSGLGLSGGRFLNTLNPAALAALDSTTFLFDVSGSSRGTKFTSGDNKQYAFGANITKITAGLHVSPLWSTALSIQPYSSVSYKVERPGYIEGTTTKINTVFEGSGGITRLSFMNSLRISKNFSVGADFMLLFGNIDRTTTISGLTLLQNSSSTTASFNAGILYTGKLTKNVILGMGAVYGYGGQLKFDNTLKVNNENSTTLFNDYLAPSYFTIPPMYGGGISIIAPRLTVNADYHYNQWSMTRDASSGLKYTDTHKFDLGLAFTPANGAVTSYFEIIQYQAGFSVSNSYLTLEGVNPVNYEITAGGSLPFKGGTQLNVALAYGKRGTVKQGLIREDYFKLTLSICIAEAWFMKRLYE